MNRFLLPLGAFALLVVVLAIGIQRSGEKGIIASPLIGKPAPAFRLSVLTDPTRMLGPEDLRGKPFLLNVWGSWCITCAQEHPMLLEIQGKKRLPIVGLNWQDEDSKALAWLAKHGNPYDIVLVDRDGRAAIDLGVSGAPETFLIDAAGTVVYKHVGMLTPLIWQRDILPKLPAR